MQRVSERLALRPRSPRQVQKSPQRDPLSDAALHCVAVDLLAEAGRQVCPLPLQFLSQCLACECIARVARYLATVTCHMSDRDGLTEGSGHCGCGDGCRLASRGVATESELSHRTAVQMPGCKLSCSIKCRGETRVRCSVSFEQGQQALDACGRPANQFPADFLRQGQVGHVRLHATIVTVNRSAIHLW